jgi:hypothetical protein
MEGNIMYCKYNETIHLQCKRCGEVPDLCTCPDEKSEEFNAVTKPKHYNSHPSGVECIEITEHYDFLIGNAIKYLWRAGIKSENPIEDFKKAIWYIERKINKLKKEA